MDHNWFGGRFILVDTYYLILGRRQGQCELYIWFEERHNGYP